VYSSGRNNRFANNTYWLGSNSRPFTWSNGPISETQWRSYGMDVSGSYNR
jgi:hypothetical protein